MSLILSFEAGLRSVWFDRKKINEEKRQQQFEDIFSHSISLDPVLVVVRGKETVENQRKTVYEKNALVRR